jgi:hypothetical protein
VGRDVEEDRVGRRFEDGVGLSIDVSSGLMEAIESTHLVLEMHVGRESSKSKVTFVERDLETDRASRLKEL